MKKNSILVVAFKYNDILYSLGQMYVNDKRFKNNIDKTAGEGTAKFVSEAISIYCSK